MDKKELIQHIHSHKQAILNYLLHHIKEYEWKISITDCSIRLWDSHIELWIWNLLYWFEIDIEDRKYHSIERIQNFIWCQNEVDEIIGLCKEKEKKQKEEEEKSVKEFWF